MTPYPSAWVCYGRRHLNPPCYAHAASSSSHPARVSCAARNGEHWNTRSTNRRATLGTIFRGMPSAKLPSMLSSGSGHSLGPAVWSGAARPTARGVAVSAKRRRRRGVRSSSKATPGASKQETGKQETSSASSRNTETPPIQNPEAPSSKSTPPPAPSKWKKKIIAAGVTPAAMIGGLASGFVSGLPAAAASLFQRPSQAVTARQDPSNSGSSYFHFAYAAPVSNSGGEYLLSETWSNFVEADDSNLSAAVQMALEIVDLANHFADNRKLSPEYKRTLVQGVLLGAYGITPERAADLLEDPSSTASPLLLPVISAIYSGPYNFFYGRGPRINKKCSEEWQNFAGPDNADLNAAVQMALEIVDLANHFADNRKLSPEFKHKLAKDIQAGRFGITPEQATDLLADPSSTASPLLLAPVISAIQSTGPLRSGI